MAVDQVKTVIFVLGMHRSGTSSLAGALDACGVWLGDDLIGADPGINAKGYWEHREVVRINENLLQACGQRWFYPEASRAVMAFLEGDIDQSLLAQARRFVAEVPEQGRVFAIKDPRLCLTAPFWFERFKEQGFEVCVVHLLRSHHEVARSLEKRDSITAAHSNALWLEYVAASEDFIRDYSVSHLRINFDSFIANPAEEMQKLFTEASLPLKVDEQKLSSWVEPALRHHRAQSIGGHSDWRCSHLKSVLAALSSARTGKSDIEIDSPYLWSAEERSFLNDLVAMFENYNRTLIRLQETAAHLDDLGKLHDKALLRIKELDDGVTHLELEKQSKIQELDSAEQRVGNLEKEVRRMKSVLGPWARYRLSRRNDEV